MNRLQTQAEHGQLAQRQPLSRTMRELIVRMWIKGLLPFTDILPLVTRLIELPFGPYKGKRKLLRYLGDRSYVSPRAQIRCPHLRMGPKCFIDDYVTIYAHDKARGGVDLDRNVHIYRWSVVELGEGQGSLRVGSNTYIQSG